MFTAVAAAGLLTACVPALSGTDDEPPQTKAECAAVKPATGGRRLRGMWIATVTGMDWPAGAKSAAAQQTRYRRLLDTAKAMRLNAVFVQVRPTADAFYASPYEPWSQWITGRQGRDPGYDVLGFMLKEAHARGLEFHTWFNPYRVSRQKKLKKLATSNPARRHPDWVRKYGDGLWYDPGLPQVRDLVSNVVLDVVRKYDIDGVHFDDYFYPYPEGGAFPDQATYKKYGKGFASKAGWRRNNVNTLIQRVSDEVHKAKPWVRFGISPFGVWRNRSTDPAGSATRALQSYDDIYADSRLWVKKGWVDYILPQLYWPIGDSRADYRTLTAWWSRQVRGTGVQLLIGHGAYRVGEPGPWRRAAELSRQVAISDKSPEVSGNVFFSARDVLSNRRGFAAKIVADHYTRPALAPVAAGRPNAKPPAHVKTTTDGKAVTIRWQGPADTLYAVYRADGKKAACAPVDPRALITTVRAGGISDPTVKPGASYTYYVTALDRANHQSTPARGSTITVSRG
ncbi:MAG TPA: family 10 glycosylhydrolase [Streptosporangiaceae bacterium]